MPGRGWRTDESLTAMVAARTARTARTERTVTTTWPEPVVPALVVVAPGRDPGTGQRRIFGRNITLEWYVMCFVPP